MAKESMKAREVKRAKQLREMASHGLIPGVKKASW